MVIGHFWGLYKWDIWVSTFFWCFSLQKKKSIKKTAAHYSNLHIFPYSCWCQIQLRRKLCFLVSFERFSARQKNAGNRKTLTYQCGSGIWKEAKSPESKSEKIKKKESKATKVINMVLKGDLPPPPMGLCGPGARSKFKMTTTVKRLPKSPKMAMVVRVTPSIQKLTESKTGIITSYFSWQKYPSSVRYEPVWINNRVIPITPSWLWQNGSSTYLNFRHLPSHSLKWNCHPRCSHCQKGRTPSSHRWY